MVQSTTVSTLSINYCKETANALSSGGIRNLGNLVASAISRETTWCRRRGSRLGNPSRLVVSLRRGGGFCWSDVRTTALLCRLRFVGCGRARLHTQRHERQSPRKRTHHLPRPRDGLACDRRDSLLQLWNGERSAISGARR